MSANKPVIVVAFLALVSPALRPLAAQSSSSSTQTPVRDPQALTILNNSLSAVGGLAAVGNIQDYTGTGNMTFYWANDPVQAQVTVRGMGTGYFRYDAVLPNGTRTWAVAQFSGVLINPDGSRVPSSSVNLATAGSLTLPYLRLTSILMDTTTSISYVGPVTTATGSQVYDIHFTPNLFGSNATPPGLTGVGSFDLYIDPTSSLIVAFIENAHSDSNFQQTLQHEIDFSNYQQRSGASVPMTITEKVSGQETWSIQLSSLSCNSGLTPQSFTP